MYKNILHNFRYQVGSYKNETVYFMAFQHLDGSLWHTVKLLKNVYSTDGVTNILKNKNSFNPT